MHEYRIEGYDRLDIIAEDASESLGFELKCDYAVVVTGNAHTAAFLLHNELDGKFYVAYEDQAANDLCCKDEVELDAEDRSERDLEAIKRSFYHRHGLDDMTDEMAREMKGCPCEFCTIEMDPDQWLDDMSWATVWSEWEWEAYDEVPIYY